jgi:hypothetical protein
MISWDIRKHNYVSLDIVEAEYIAACDACMEALWFCKLVSGLFDQVLDSTMVYCDNHGCVKLSDNPVLHDRSKNIDIKYYFIRGKI